MEVGDELPLMEILVTSRANRAQMGNDSEEKVNPEKEGGDLNKD